MRRSGFGLYRVTVSVMVGLELLLRIVLGLCLWFGLGLWLAKQ